MRTKINRYQTIKQTKATYAPPEMMVTQVRIEGYIAASANPTKRYFNYVPGDNGEKYVWNKFAAFY
jgi:hypothetical protein